MSTPRFFVNCKVRVGSRVSLGREIAHHIIHSLRLKKGEKLVLVDPSEREFICSVEDVGRREVQVHVLEESENNPESPVHVAVGISLVTASKLDTIIRHITELGVTEIIPFQAERSQLKCHHVQKRKRRLNEIAKSASQQSGRIKIPSVSDAVLLDELLERNDYTLKLVSWEKEASKYIRDIYKEQQKADNVIVLIGPEGGFTEEEIQKSVEKGFKPFSLGPRILRCETAAIVSVALVQHYWGDLGIFS